MEACTRMSICELQEKLKPIIGKKINMPKTSNKGEAGTLLEKLSGIPQSSACLDCTDGELKVFPVYRDTKGILKPKQTIAMTMLDTAMLKTTTFNDSRVYAKLKRTLYVPYERNGDEVVYMTPTLIDLTLDENVELYSKLCSDYDLIREKYVKDNKLSSSDGTLMQNRTKGAGHGSKSRAFYMKKGFATEYISF